MCFPERISVVILAWERTRYELIQFIDTVIQFGIFICILGVNFVILSEISNLPSRSIDINNRYRMEYNLLTVADSIQKSQRDIEPMNKILIVDDESNNRTLLQEILEDFEENGTRLLYAADGAEALDLIKSERPALVFLDVVLPKMDGFEICHTVKDELGLNDIFIAMLTAKAQDTDKRQAKRVKADAYIAKPFKIKTITDVVATVFNPAGGVIIPAVKDIAL